MNSPEPLETPPELVGNGEIHAVHYRSRKPICVTWENGIITRLSESLNQGDAIDWVAPPLFDLQVNGFAGIDFQQDDLSLESLLVATRQLRKAACTRYCFTLISDHWEILIGRVRNVMRLRGQSAELSLAIAGFHIEGPFLSPEPGFRGAHDATVMCDPNPAQVEELRA